MVRTKQKTVKSEEPCTKTIVYKTIVYNVQEDERNLSFIIN